MATTKSSISSDSATTLRDLIGDDASATFESDTNFIDSDAGASGSSNHVMLRDTDDTEDSEEEEDEAFDDDEEEDEEDDEEEEDDEDEEDDDEEIDSDVLRMAEPINVHGPGKHDRADIEEELEEMEEETGAEDEAESVEETEEDDDEPRVDRGINAALRMSALVAIGSGFAANPRGMA